MRDAQDAVMSNRPCQSIGKRKRRAFESSTDTEGRGQACRRIALSFLAAHRDKTRIRPAPDKRGNSVGNDRLRTAPRYDLANRGWLTSSAASGLRRPLTRFESRIGGSCRNTVYTTLA